MSTLFSITSILTSLFFLSEVEDVTFTDADFFIAISSVGKGLLGVIFTEVVVFNKGRVGSLSLMRKGRNGCSITCAWAQAVCSKAVMGTGACGRC